MLFPVAVNKEFAMAIIIMLDDDGNEFDVTDRINELVEEAQQLAEENEELEAYCEEVAASFGEVEKEEAEETISLSNDAFLAITGQTLELAASPKTPKQKLGASAGATVSPKGVVKPKSAAPIAGVVGNGTGKKAMKQGLKVKSASLGKHLKHVGKVASRFTRKLSPTAGAAIGAGLGAVAGTGAVAMLKRKNANANPSARGLAASHQNLQLDTEEEIEELEDEDFENMSPEELQEQFDLLDPEQQQEFLEELHAEEQEELVEYAGNVLVEDAESRNPKSTTNGQLVVAQ